MKKFLIIGFLLSLQLNLMAVSADNVKHNSHALCDVLNYNNNANNVLDQQLLFDSAKLVSLVKDMVASIDDIAFIQKTCGRVLSLEQYVIVNKHIVSLNLIRKKLLHIQNTYKLPLGLQETFNFYRNSIDAHYYQLNPSYESYLLKQCNLSIKETNRAVLYTTGSFLSWCFLGELLFLNSLSYAKQTMIEMTVEGSLALTSAYLAYCAYKSIHNPSYQYDLI